VNLSWTASTDNVGVTGYRIYRNDSTTPLTTVTSGTSYTDSSVVASTPYTYQVSAIDAAGNESAKASVSVTTPSGGSTGATTLTFTPTNDATVNKAAPTTNYGTANRVTVDGSPVNAFFLQFDVAGTSSCTVTDAKLRLTVGSTTYDNSAYGGDLYGVASNSWSESTLNWNNQPASGTTKVGSIASAVKLNTSYTIDVTPLIVGDGPVSMKLASANGDAAKYWSKEGSTAAQKPQLQVTCGSSGGSGGGGGDTTSPSTPTGLTATAASSTSVKLAWTASTDDVGVTGYRVYRNNGTTPLATVSSGTAYTDSSVAAGTSYIYQVSAVDAAGNESGKASASVTTPSGGSTGATQTFTPTNDATVNKGSPTTNYGTANRIIAGGSPLNSFFIQFDVTGTSGCTVTSAKLRLTVGSTTADNAPYGGDVYGVPTNTWSESTVNWNNQPAASSTKVASIPTTVKLNTSYTWDVTPLVTGDGYVSMKVVSANSDAAKYWSKDGSTSAQAPQLQVTCG
jgi:chitodextrinase